MSSAVRPVRPAHTRQMAPLTFPMIALLSVTGSATPWGRGSDKDRATAPRPWERDKDESSHYRRARKTMVISFITIYQVVLFRTFYYQFMALK